MKSYLEIGAYINRLSFPHYEWKNAVNNLFSQISVSAPSEIVNFIGCPAWGKRTQ